MEVVQLVNRKLRGGRKMNVYKRAPWEAMKHIALDMRVREEIGCGQNG